MSNRLNYRLRDLNLIKEDYDLLNELSGHLSIKNSIIARLLLHRSLQEIKLQGFDSFALAVIGLKSKTKVKQSKP